MFYASIIKINLTNNSLRVWIKATKVLNSTDHAFLSRDHVFGIFCC